jgi:glycosyltransferase involved in cell wall biosynthesis
MLSNGQKCVVLYAGLHGLAQGLNQIIEAATLLKDKPEIQFVLLGDGPEKRELVKMASERKLTNITFHKPVSQENMPSIIASADIMVIPLKTYIPGAVPSKLYEAMACGRPVVLIASGEADDIVSKHGAGIVVSPGDINGLVSALCNLSNSPERRKNLGNCGHRAAVTQYNRSLIVNRFIEYLERQL